MFISTTFSLSTIRALFRESLDDFSNELSGLPSKFWGRKGKVQVYLDYVLSELDPILSQKRMAAAVVSIERETFETSTIVLRPPSRWRGFKAGQYIALEMEIEGVRYRRNYSLSCSPKFYEKTGKISVTVKTVDQGKVSEFLNRSISVADIVYISEARGKFTLPCQIDEPLPNRPVFVAGGSGVTPIRSMLDHLLEVTHRNSESESEEIMLIHYAKNADDIIFQDHFESLAEQNDRFIYIKHFSDMDGNVSAKQLDQDCSNLKGRSLYLCGPEGFMSAVRKAAKGLFVPEESIYSESFGGGLIPFANADETEAGIIDFSFAGQQIQSNGEKSLLELAEQAGLAPKFGCRSGICHECKCHRPEGRLFNRMTGEPISEDSTHIQSCIAVPSGNLTLKQW